MGASGHETGGLAQGIVGSARVTAFGTSVVAPAASVIAGLVIVVSYAGFASPLVVIITGRSHLARQRQVSSPSGDITPALTISVPQDRCPRLAGKPSAGRPGPHSRRRSTARSIAS